jgi:hypothetical protein
MAPWALLFDALIETYWLRSVCRPYKCRRFAEINAIGKNGDKRGEGPQRRCSRLRVTKGTPAVRTGAK